MSANNWMVCPKCKKLAKEKREAELIAFKHRVQAEAVAFANGEIQAERSLPAERDALLFAFAQVAMDEWLKKSNEASQPVQLAEQFREDWELGMDSKGVFEVDYHGSCQACGFEFSFKHKENALT